MGNSICLLLAKLLMDLQQESSFAETFPLKHTLPIFQKKKKFQFSNLKMVVKSNFKQKIYFCNCLWRNTLLVSKKWYTNFRH